jgi:hypothetical protein
MLDQLQQRFAASGAKHDSSQSLPQSSRPMTHGASPEWMGTVKWKIAPRGRLALAHSPPP